MFVGDVVQLDATVRHGVATPRIVWRSSNTAIVQVGPTGRLRALAAGRATVTAEVDETTDQMAVEVLELPSLYQPRDVEYFGEVAFGTEAGTGEAVLRKWATAPRIRVHGAPTPADQAALVSRKRWLASLPTRGRPGSPLILMMPSFSKWPSTPPTACL